MADFSTRHGAVARARHHRRSSLCFCRFIRPVRDLVLSCWTRNDDLAGRDLWCDPQRLHAGDKRHFHDHYGSFHECAIANRALLSFRRWTMTTVAVAYAVKKYDAVAALDGVTMTFR